MTKKQLLNEIVDFYSNSADSNGLPVSALLHRKEVKVKTLKRLVVDLEAQDKIDVVFAEVDENPHIRRLPSKMRKPFSYLIEHCDLEKACLYPSALLIAEKIDLSRWKDQPYNVRLWAGGAQLDLVFFDLAVLERYRNDPRYVYAQNFFGGSIYLKVEHYLDDGFAARDKVLLERFGIGYGADNRWVIGVILRDLRALSPAHQGIWRGYELDEECTLNEASLRTWFFGEWLEYNSIFDALTEEIRVINKMTRAAFGKSMFKQTYEEGMPKGFGVLLRPTEQEFMDFARTLDLMLSENIDKDFFPPFVERTFTERHKDGTEKTIVKGTISLLKDWIRGAIKVTDGDPSKEISDAFQKVRGLRSKASHNAVGDTFDYKYEAEQRELIIEAYGALRTLRLLLANHPKSAGVEVPEWLYNGDIRTL